MICRLPDDFQLLALALLSLADDEGYFRADPSIVRGEVMPFREDLARIREGLETLQEKGWIELAEHLEQGLIGRITKWSMHQKVDHPSPSKLKSYFVRENIANPRDVSSKPPESLALDQGSGIKDHKNPLSERKPRSDTQGLELSSTEVARAICCGNGWSGKSMIFALKEAIDFQSAQMPEASLQEVGEWLARAYFDRCAAKGAFAGGPQKFFEQALYRSGSSRRANGKVTTASDDLVARTVAQMEAE